MIDAFFPNSIPVCFLGDNIFILYKCGSIYTLSSSSLNVLYRQRIFFGFKESCLSHFKILSRILRLGIRSSCPISDTSFVFYVNNKIFEYDVKTQLLSKGFSLKSRVRPLQFSYVKSVDGFPSGVYFGEYFSNPLKKEVSIYFRNRPDCWTNVYTFNKGLINHIHALIPDEYNNCIWIFTGDFDNASCIWRASNNFDLVEPVLVGKQKYRGCVGFATKEGILYATDSQFEENSIRIMKKSDGEFVSVEVCKINGSCIYGCKLGENYVFATSVEGYGIYKNNFDFLKDRKIGPGIKTDDVCIYMGNLDTGFIKIYSQKKDLFPFIFQFGSFQFPSGINNIGRIVFRQIAVKNNDLCTIILKV